MKTSDCSLTDAQLLADIKDYTDQLKNDPGADVFCQLAQNYARLGLDDSAITALRQGLAQNPNHLAGQLLLADLLGSSGQIDDAMAAYGKVLQRHPECVDALIGLARLDLKQANKGRARTHLDKARQLQPDHSGLQEVALQLKTRVSGLASGSPEIPLATATVAELYVKQGLTEKAVEVYKTLVCQQPNNEVLRTRLNELLDETGANEIIQGTPIGEKLERWLGAIQRRRNNV